MCRPITSREKSCHLRKPITRGRKNRRVCRNCDCAGAAQERFRQTAGKEGWESCMMLSQRDLDILRLLRWCRMIRSKELYETFSKDEVMNLCAAQMIRFSDAVKAWYLTPCGNRVLGSNVPRTGYYAQTAAGADRHNGVCRWRQYISDKGI